MAVDVEYRGERIRNDDETLEVEWLYWVEDIRLRGVRSGYTGIRLAWIRAESGAEVGVIVRELPSDYRVADIVKVEYKVQDGSCVVVGDFGVRIDNPYWKVYIEGELLRVIGPDEVVPEIEISELAEMEARA